MIIRVWRRLWPSAVSQTRIPALGAAESPWSDEHPTVYPMTRTLVKVVTDSISANTRCRGRSSRG